MNINNDMMNIIKANRALKIVQQQSVHFLCFSYTGRFLNVNTFYKKIGSGLTIFFCILLLFRIKFIDLFLNTLNQIDFQ